MRAQGQISLLAIATIFVVVFALMWGGLQYSRGELIDHEPADDGEQRVREALWDAFDDFRTGRGLEPAERSRGTGSVAQDTARVIAEGDYFGEGPTPTRPLPNDQLSCSQVAVRLDLPADVTGDGSISTEEAAAVAGRAVPLLVSVDDAGLTVRSGPFRNGFGVVVRDGWVYVVLRSCENSYY